MNGTLVNNTLTSGSTTLFPIGRLCCLALAELVSLQQPCILPMVSTSLIAYRAIALPVLTTALLGLPV